MKCQKLFLGKVRKNVTSLSSAEVAQRVVKVNITALHFSLGGVVSLNMYVCLYCRCPLGAME